MDWGLTVIGDTNTGILTIRGGIRAALEAENPVLAAFEPIMILDGTAITLKIGDGVRALNDLPAIGGGTGGGGAYVEADTEPVGAADGTIWRNTSPAV